ncbi:MAG: hypothetical protein AB7N76_07550 [Planctomycetota bacterium]
MAVVLCGAGLAIVAGGVAAAMRAESYADDLTRAADHVDLLLARLESQELAIEDASGDFGDDGADDLFWEVAVTAPQDVQLEGLQEVRVTVRWLRYSSEQELSIVRWMFLDPQQGGVR